MCAPLLIILVVLGILTTMGGCSGHSVRVAESLKGESLIESCQNVFIQTNQIVSFPSSQAASFATISTLDGQSLEVIDFAYDSTRLMPGARQLLERRAAWLKKHPSVKIIVSGHSDENGYDEYNVALGERRAIFLKLYLTNLGIAANRIHLVDDHAENVAWKNL